MTPLASIFGSGFLILVPLLERILGAAAVVGALAVVILAWLIGMAIRRLIAIVEPLAASGRLDARTQALEQLGDFVIVVAYVISVALYLRIMASYIVSYAAGPSDVAERALASGAIAAITLVGVLRGFGGLDLMERLALGAVLVLTTLLSGAFLISDFGQVAGSGLELPPVPSLGIGEVALILGGIVISVQGFETVRYLADEYDAQTRIWASRLAQLVAASIYVGFTIVATPLMGLGTEAGPDRDLLDIVERVAPLLALPLVLCAVLSQFSAATADTVAAAGNLTGLFSKRMRGATAYLLSGAGAIVLALTIPTFTIIVIASRAFAAYYAIQALLVVRTTGSVRAKAGYGTLAALMLAITLLAKPAG